MFTVYSLVDQRDDEVFYIGITEDVYTRFSQHLQCNGSNIDKNERIQRLKDENIMLVMRTLEVVEGVEEARTREQHWIHHYLAQGIRLLNIDIARTFTFEAFQTFFTPKVKTIPQSCTSIDKQEVGARRGSYSMTKVAASELLRCPISEIERGIMEGIIKPFAKSGDKVLVSSLEGFVPQKRSRKTAKVATK